ncbi:SDR family NAD(P)-dependent oxidoreductase [Rathayibacter tanaceti]|uniref:3-oxoacyl-[acyl-carrier-protein] reductase FabG n=2 Tax=Rathayibacter tanaceti TaxID=1671680 RepID=A0A166IFL6_9MICO|nr:SDR family oxidoreductase [Rathayibacter tanaceti]KZX22303.1 3-oxoacyl-[acyl-carrier-protein] reductase FabG [Rathayibacter tanaceti]QHC56128.1 SDR family NAD(P)-dependent oxidoreductase [Rathayibacter tanaceti]TCO36965.1 3-oxoacyl-[acyl-carrier protein] reductase [Rathayibacter tanaceti]
MIVVVTGARTGIGRGMVEHLLAGGHRVIGCSRRRSSLTHPDYEHHEADLTDGAAVRSLFRRVGREHGAIDALVNNAGTSVTNHFLLMPDETTRRIFDLNFFAALHCSSEAVRLLQASGYAAPTIINVSSIAVAWSLPGQLAYAASKGALEQMTKTMSKELGATGIRVNTLGLPVVATALSRSVDPETVRALLDRQAIARMCTLEDIVGPLDFLLSTSSAFVTGETVYLGGVH